MASTLAQAVDSCRHTTPPESSPYPKLPGPPESAAVKPGMLYFAALREGLRTPVMAGTLSGQGQGTKGVKRRAAAAS